LPTNQIHKKENVEKKMSKENNNNNNEMSKEAKRKMQERKEERSKMGMYFNPKAGEKYLRGFDPDQVEIVPDRFNEGKNKFEYTIVDPNTGETQKWTTGKKNSDRIDSLLEDNHRLLMIERQGRGISDTNYYIYPAD
jgi:hypothetical protein